jgi:hypothetical protein
VPQYDAYHYKVKRALANDGWKVTDDPFVIEYEDVQLKADLGAEKAFAAEKGERKIVVEVKVFGGLSFFNDLHKATGQYCNYRALLEETNPEREIWLAVSSWIYETHFQRPSTRKIIDAQQISLLVFDVDSEEVVQWIK